MYIHVTANVVYEIAKFLRVKIARERDREKLLEKRVLRLHIGEKDAGERAKGAARVSGIARAAALLFRRIYRTPGSQEAARA